MIIFNTYTYLVLLKNERYCDIEFFKDLFDLLSDLYHE